MFLPNERCLFQTLSKYWNLEEILENVTGERKMEYISQISGIYFVLMQYYNYTWSLTHVLEFTKEVGGEKDRER